MLSGLLWRCPVCKENNSIVHTHRRFRADKVGCTRCDSAWELHRVRGGVDYLFKATAGSMAGTEFPLAEWYDMMREGFALIPLDPGNFVLESGEEIYLKGKSSNITVIRKDPRFSGAIETLPPPETTQPDGSPPPMAPLGAVDLYLTNKRLIVFHKGQSIGLDLDTFRGIEVLLDRFLIIRHAKKLIEIFEFQDESPLNGVHILSWS